MSRQWLLSLTVALAASPLALADEAKIVPREILEKIVDDNPNPLPRYMTPAEAKLPLPLPARGLDGGPVGSVYTPPEYDFNEGLFISWGSYNSALTAMTVGVTTGDPEAIMYILVDGPSQQASCTSTLTGAGADMSQVEFITYSTNTVWIRDYGPRFIFEDQSRAIVDHTYNRPRPLDNAFNDHLAQLWNEPEYDIPLTHGGGNFHLFANGDAFMSSLILAENPGLSEQDVKDYYAEYQNLDLTIYEGFPTNFDSTRHIDMWMFPVTDDTIIIGEYAPSTGAPYTITENAVADLTARGYTVYRTPGWNSGGTHYTYTNAVVLNDIVFVSEFSGYTSQNAEALSVFQTAFPDHQVIPVDCSSVIHAAGAIHCIVMHVPGYATQLRVTPGAALEASGPAGGPFTPDSIVYAVENAGEFAIDYSVTTGATWLDITNGAGTLAPFATADVTVAINSQANSLPLGSYNEAIQFVNVTNGDGDTSRQASLTIGVPAPVYTFNMDDNPGWSMNGEWDFGEPAGGGGSQHGYPDPSSGATGTNVCGVNLDGDYSTSTGGPWHLTTGALDCSELIQTSLHFERWLNSDYQPYTYATVEISTNGTSWDMIWQNGGSEITENAWNAQVYDVSSYADGQETVYIRWGYQVGSGAWAYSGWNVDDVVIWGVDTGGGNPCPADINTDGTVDVLDLLAVLAAWGNAGGPEDINADGVVDVLDLLELLASWGPCA